MCFLDIVFLKMCYISRSIFVSEKALKSLSIGFGEEEEEGEDEFLRAKKLT